MGKLWLLLSIIFVLTANACTSVTENAATSALLTVPANSAASAATSSLEKRSAIASLPPATATRPFTPQERSIAVHGGRFIVSIVDDLLVVENRSTSDIYYHVGASEDLAEIELAPCETLSTCFSEPLQPDASERQSLADIINAATERIEVNYWIYEIAADGDTLADIDSGNIVLRLYR